jgi:hypothetical protein
VMRQDVDESVNDRDLLAEFFAEQNTPGSSESSFTPAQVADIVRRDRDASE